MKKTICSFFMITFAIFNILSHDAQAVTTYYVNVASSTSFVRYIPSASFQSVEIVVNNNGVNQSVWYIQQVQGALDSILTALITTPHASITDLRLQCNTPVTVSGTQQVFYAGAGQNCAIQMDTK